MGNMMPLWTGQETQLIPDLNALHTTGHAVVPVPWTPPAQLLAAVSSTRVPSLFSKSPGKMRECPMPRPHPPATAWEPSLAHTCVSFAPSFPDSGEQMPFLELPVAIGSLLTWILFGLMSAS